MSKYTCPEGDNSFVCYHCYTQGFRGPMNTFWCPSCGTGKGYLCKPNCILWKQPEESNIKLRPNLDKVLMGLHWNETITISFRHQSSLQSIRVCVDSDGKSVVRHHRAVDVLQFRNPNTLVAAIAEQLETLRRITDATQTTKTATPQDSGPDPDNQVW